MQFIHKPLDFDFKKLKDKTGDNGRYYFEPDNPAIKWPSITTVLKEYKSAPIKAWRKRVGEKAANEITKKAASRGDSLHKMIEMYLDNQDPSTFKYTSAHKMVFNQTRKIIDKNINNIVLQETALVSKTLRVAGRVDLIAEWAGKLSVIDFKSANKRKKEEWISDYYMQASFYAFAFWEATGILPKQVVILISSDDYAVVPFIANSSKFIPQLKEQVQKWYKLYNVTNLI